MVMVNAPPPPYGEWPGVGGSWPLPLSILARARRSRYLVWSEMKCHALYQNKSPLTCL
jgi:hypothetical protein